MKRLRDVIARSATLAVGAAGALLVAMLAPGPGAAQTVGGPPDLTLTSKGKSVTATRGSSCWFGDGAGICADAAYPLKVRCALPVKRGAKLTVETVVPATSISAQLVNATGLARRALPAWKSGRDNVTGSSVWTFRITRKARRAAAIDVFGYFPQGDLDTWTGIATGACRDS